MASCLPGPRVRPTLSQGSPAGSQVKSSSQGARSSGAMPAALWPLSAQGLGGAASLFNDGRPGTHRFSKESLRCPLSRRWAAGGPAAVPEQVRSPSRYSPGSSPPGRERLRLPPATRRPFLLRPPSRRTGATFPTCHRLLPRLPGNSSSWNPVSCHT